MLSSTQSASHTNKIKSKVSAICKTLGHPETGLSMHTAVFDATLLDVDKERKELWKALDDKDLDDMDQETRDMYRGRMLNVISGRKCSMASGGTIRILLEKTEANPGVYAATIVVPIDAFPKGRDAATHLSEYKSHFESEQAGPRIKCFVTGNTDLELSPGCLADTCKRRPGRLLGGYIGGMEVLLAYS